MPMQLLYLRQQLIYYPLKSLEDLIKITLNWPLNMQNRY